MSMICSIESVPNDYIDRLQTDGVTLQNEQEQPTQHLTSVGLIILLLLIPLLFFGSRHWFPEQRHWILLIGGTIFAALMIAEYLKRNKPGRTHYVSHRPDCITDEISLDKAWHGIHYLLTESAWEGAAPLNFLITGGIEVGEGIGYGPERFFNAEQVADIYNELSQLDESVLEKRFNPEVMSEESIYPDTWDEPGESDWLMSYFDILNPFIKNAVNRGEGIIVSLY